MAMYPSDGSQMNYGLDFEKIVHGFVNEFRFKNDEEKGNVKDEKAFEEKA